MMVGALNARVYEIVSGTHFYINLLKYVIKTQYFTRILYKNFLSQNETAIFYPLI